MEVLEERHLSVGCPVLCNVIRSESRECNEDNLLQNYLCRTQLLLLPSQNKLFFNQTIDLFSNKSNYVVISVTKLSLAESSRRKRQLSWTALERIRVPPVGFLRTREEAAKSATYF